MSQSSKRLRIQTWTSCLEYLLDHNVDSLCDFLTTFELGILSQTCLTYFHQLDTQRFTRAKIWATSHSKDSINTRLLVLSLWFRQKYDGHFTIPQFESLARILVSDSEVNAFGIQEISYSTGIIMKTDTPWLPWYKPPTKKTLAFIRKHRFPPSLFNSSNNWTWLSKFRVGDLFLLGYTNNDFIQCDLRPYGKLESVIECDISELNWQTIVTLPKKLKSHVGIEISSTIVSKLINELESDSVSGVLFTQYGCWLYLCHRVRPYTPQDLVNIGATCDCVLKSLKVCQYIPPLAIWKWLIEGVHLKEIKRAIFDARDIFTGKGFPCIIDTMKLLFVGGFLNKVLDTVQNDPKYDIMRDRIKQASLLQ